MGFSPYSAVYFIASTVDNDIDSKAIVDSYTRRQIGIYSKSRVNARSELEVD